MAKQDQTQQIIDLITALAPVALALFQAGEPVLAKLVSDLTSHVAPSLTQPPSA